MSEPEEIKRLVTDLELVEATLSREEDAFDSLCSPWNDVISALWGQASEVAKIREANPVVILRRQYLADLRQELADLKSEFYRLKLKEAKK